MFYKAGEHKAAGLTYDPFKAIVAPRPIGWISVVSKGGQVNLSPYSFFNAFSGRPPIVAFSSEGIKDAVAFVSETGEFVCNLATLDLAVQMNETSAPLPRGDNEFMHAGLAMVPSQLVKPPRIAGVATALECKLLQIISPNDLSGQPAGCHIVMGQVVGVHIDDRFVENGRLNTVAMKPIARLGYDEYGVIDKSFKIARPEGGG